MPRTGYYELYSSTFLSGTVKCTLSDICIVYRLYALRDQRLTLESWFTNLEQTSLNRSQHDSYQRPTNDLLTRSSKTNYERTTGELTV